MKPLVHFSLILFLIVFHLMLCFGRLYGIQYMVKAANKLSNSQDFVDVSVYLLCF